MMKTIAVIAVVLIAIATLVNTKSLRPKRATGCAAIQIVSRSQWGVSTPPSGSNLVLPVKWVFIHHTEGPTCSDLSSCSNVVKGIYNDHTYTKNWGDIGYSFLIGGDGRVYQGVGWDKVGAHTYGTSYKSIAISFIGSYTSVVPSAAMQNAAKNLILCGISLNKISTVYGLYSHRDGYCTDCPGNAFYAALASWSYWHRFGTIQQFCRG